METGSVPVRPVLEEVDKRVLTLTTGTAKVDEADEELHDRRPRSGHGPKCPTWIMDPGKGYKDLPRQEGICTLGTIEDKDWTFGETYFKALPASRSGVKLNYELQYDSFWFKWVIVHPTSQFGAGVKEPFHL